MPSSSPVALSSLRTLIDGSPAASRFLSKAAKYVVTLTPGRERYPSLSDSLLSYVVRQQLCKVIEPEVCRAGHNRTYL
mgnify:CR=1 FL=1